MLSALRSAISDGCAWADAFRPRQRPVQQWRASSEPLRARVTLRARQGEEYYSAAFEAESYQGGFRLVYMPPMPLRALVFSLDSQQLRFTRALKGQLVVHDGPAMQVTLLTLEAGTHVELCIALSSPVQVHGQWKVLP